MWDITTFLDRTDTFTEKNDFSRKLSGSVFLR